MDDINKNKTIGCVSGMYRKMNDKFSFRLLFFIFCNEPIHVVLKHPNLTIYLIWWLIRYYYYFQWHRFLYLTLQFLFGVYLFIVL